MNLLFLFTLTVAFRYISAEIDSRPPCGPPPTVAYAYISRIVAIVSRVPVAGLVITDPSDPTQFTTAQEHQATYACLSGDPTQGDPTISCLTSTLQWTFPPYCPEIRPVTTEEPTTEQTTTEEQTTTTQDPYYLVSELCYLYQLDRFHSLCQPPSSGFIAPREANILSILENHNYYRRNVVPPALDMTDLKWHPDLAATAQAWANTCPSDHDQIANRALPRRFEEAAWPWVGQNMYWTKSNIGFREIIDNWASQRSNWFYGITNPLSPVGHYTQIISSKTFFLGCGKAECSGEWKYIYICNYAPGGNVNEGIGSVSTPYTAEEVRKIPEPVRFTAPYITPNGLTRPKRGPQCKFGFEFPHETCLPDSDMLISLEPVPMREIIVRHNQYRRDVYPPAENLPRMSWDTDLAIEAERRAAQCQLLADGEQLRELPERGNRPAWNKVGQTFCINTGLSWTECIDQWGSQRENWQFGYGSTNGSNVDSYVQMISEKSTFIGCGKALCRDPTGDYSEVMIMVCNYGEGIDPTDAASSVFPYADKKN